MHFSLLFIGEIRKYVFFIDLQVLLLVCNSILKALKVNDNFVIF